MIQQNFEFRKTKDISPIAGKPSSGYCVEVKDAESGIKVDIWGFRKNKGDVLAFLKGLKAHTETGGLNPVSKALVQFGYWLQVNYNRLKDWYNGLNSA